MLPNNYSSAHRSLENTEKGLRKRPAQAKETTGICYMTVYGDQVRDMVQRRAARKLDPTEKFEGTVHYIPTLIVENPESLSTPVRLVFDASRPQGKEKICLNDCLSKGPDAYLNNLCKCLVGFRAGKLAAKGDISKFYNATRLEEEDCHVQRFLWRDGEDREPDIYVVTVNNIGIKPSGTVAGCMLEKLSLIHI